MLAVMRKQISLWWRFKQLDRTYQPLLEKAMSFGNRDALLKLEEQYWYQTACLLEERREIRKAKYIHNHLPQKQHNTSNGSPIQHAHSGILNYESEREMTYRDGNVRWRVVILVGTGLILLSSMMLVLSGNSGFDLFSTDSFSRLLHSL